MRGFGGKGMRGGMWRLIVWLLGKEMEMLPEEKRDPRVEYDVRGMVKGMYSYDPRAGPWER
jgi:hypothetical protein